MKTYQKIAMAFNARANCAASNNEEWFEKHEETILDIIKNKAPSGSGFDSGTSFNFDKSTEEEFVFDTAYHHMNDGGYYDGWTKHKVIVTPSLSHNFLIRITGRDRNAIKDYISDCFYEFLDEEYKE